MLAQMASFHYKPVITFIIHRTWSYIFIFMITYVQEKISIPYEPIQKMKDSNLVFPSEILRVLIYSWSEGLENNIYIYI